MWILNSSGYVCVSIDNDKKCHAGELFGLTIFDPVPWVNLKQLPIIHPE